MKGKRNRNQPEAELDQRPVEELFLLHLRYKEARLVETGSNQPILLTDKDTAWVVYTGRIDLFAVQLAHGQVAGPRVHLYRVEAGQALLGIDNAQIGGQIGLLAVGNKETTLLKLPISRLQALSQDKEFGPAIVSMLERWVEQLSNCLSPALPPKDCLNLETGRERVVASQTHASAKRSILWIEHIEGKSYFMGQPQFTVNGQGYMPLSAHTWIETIEDCRIQAQSTASFLTHDPTWSALDNFHQLVLQHIWHTAQQSAQADKQRLQDRLTSNQEVINEALASLAAPLVLPGHRTLTGTGQKTLLHACRLVAEQMGIPLVEPPTHRVNGTNLDPLAEIARASRFQWRRVVLKGCWWQLDGGPFLGYWEESKQPVAILPQSAKSYVVYDPVTGSRIKVTDEVAERLSPFAIMFYRPFASQVVSALDMLKFGFYGRRHELQTILLAGLAVSLLSLVIPIATGLIFNTIIPNAAQDQLWQLGFAMFIIALAVAMFQVTQNIAVLRLQGKMGIELQAAVWNRLISLPASFFRDYSAGDLGNRAMGINVIQQTFSGQVIYAFLSGIFSIFSFFLLFTIVNNWH
ncbi:MAG: hypothetical protein HC804_05260 [Anaerolineae bacterium]|nr:hypothetical protein [Anaerolineae bacterium]